MNTHNLYCKVNSIVVLIVASLMHIKYLFYFTMCTFDITLPDWSRYLVAILVSRQNKNISYL